jgi:hypothetical protein
VTDALAIFAVPASVQRKSFWLAEVKMGRIMRSKSVQDLLDAVLADKKGERLAREENADIARGESLQQ